MKKSFLFAGIFSLGFFLSSIHPHDYFTWILEVFPSIIGVTILAITGKKFQFTTIAYIVILIHCYILFVGGHYTYAEVPMFSYLQEAFHQTRNNYDKIGHFMQGFTPTLLSREVFIRKKIITSKSWLGFLSICLSLAISSCYELLEWFVASCSGEASDSFLGTQGYVWDTQSDMLFALIGACCMLLFFGRVHHLQIEKMNN